MKEVDPKEMHVDSIEGLIGAYQIQDIAVVEMTDGHDKVYVILTIEEGGETYLVRFWGKWGSSLQHKIEKIQGGEFDAILQAKLEKDYTPVESYERLDQHSYSGQMAEVLESITGVGF